MKRLTDDELRDVLGRAEEIQRTERRGDEWKAEVAAVIGAAEELGLSRQAVERALAERLNLSPTPPTVGALTWARSVDGKFYVAEVLSVHEDSVRVRFQRGSEHNVAMDELRPCAFIPGERVACNWPWWGPWTCTVIAYDPIRHRVKLNDGWGYSRWFPVSEVWLAAARAEPGSARNRVYAKLIGAGAALGALLGSAVTALLLR